MSESSTNARPGFLERIDAVRRLIDALFDDFEATEQAVVADGWPRAMVREGFALHRKTWDAAALVRALALELSPYGGVEALERFVQPEAAGPGREGRRMVGSGAVRLLPPREVVHIWPALPGAGLTPVLFGMLLGVEQRIRPSRRGLNFARLVIERSGIALAHQPRWQEAEVVVVSGSDETLEAVRDQLSPGSRLVGYGHRVSFAVVVDDDALDLDPIADAIARDVVMWHQMGCFSARGVVFCGREARARSFSGALGNAIEAAEIALDATSLDEGALLDAGTLGRRAQALGLAKFSSPVCGRGIGWVQPSREPFTGRQISPHVATLHRVDTLDVLPSAVSLPPHHIQGVALAIADDDPRRDAAHDVLAGLGATRICAPGALQAPPAGWPHDGRPNVLEWLRISSAF